MEYDPGAPVWGVKYDGYLVYVETSDGKIIATKGKSLFEKKRHNLLKAKVGNQLDKNLKPTGGTQYLN